MNATDFAVSVPVSGIIECPDCEQSFQGFARLAKHRWIAHQRATLAQCSRCDRTDANYRSITIHFGKCRPRPAAAVVPLPYECPLCLKRFKAKSGVSQHRRHVHINEVNRERLQASQAAEMRRNQQWSASDTATLWGLFRRYGAIPGRATYYAKLRELFPGYTLDQLKYRLRVAKRNAAGSGQSAPSPRNDDMAVDPPSEETPLISETCAHREPRNGKSDSAAEDRAQVEVRALSTLNPPRKVPRRVRGARKGKRHCRRDNRAAEFAECQRKWCVSPATVAGLILDEGTASAGSPDLAAAESYFKAVFEQANTADHAYPRAYHSTTCDSLMCRISSAEVRKAITALKATSSAGPDGLTVTALKKGLRSGRERMISELMTEWLDNRRVPGSQLASRTVLLPKPGASPGELPKWRPISVGNILGRVFSTIMRTRLEAIVPPVEPQRGFRKCSGVAENSFLVDTIIRKGNAETDCTAVVLLGGCYGGPSLNL